MVGAASKLKLRKTPKQFTDHRLNSIPSALNSFSCSLIDGSINQEIITYQALQLVRVPTNVCKIKDDNTESYRNISYLLLLSSVSLMELHLYPENHQSVFFSQNQSFSRVLIADEPRYISKLEK